MTEGPTLLGVDIDGRVKADDTTPPRAAPTGPPKAPPMIGAKPLTSDPMENPMVYLCGRLATLGRELGTAGACAK